MRKDLFKSLMVFRTPTYNIESIANGFPFSIANLLKSFMTKTFSDMQYPIRYDYNRLMEFKINLGIMIHKQDFSSLYSVFIQFLNSFNYFYAMYVFHIKFPETALVDFKKKCDSFKDKEWNDIISELVDAVYELFSQGTFANKPVE